MRSLQKDCRVLPLQFTALIILIWSTHAAAVSQMNFNCVQLLTNASESQSSAFLRLIEMARGKSVQKREFEQRIIDPMIAANRPLNPFAGRITSSLEIQISNAIDEILKYLDSSSWQYLREHLKLTKVINQKIVDNEADAHTEARIIFDPKFISSLPISRSPKITSLSFENKGELAHFSLITGYPHLALIDLAKGTLVTQDVFPKSFTPKSNTDVFMAPFKTASSLLVFAYGSIENIVVFHDDKFTFLNVRSDVKSQDMILERIVVWKGRLFALGSETNSVKPAVYSYSADLSTGQLLNLPDLPEGPRGKWIETDAGWIWAVITADNLNAYLLTPDQSEDPQIHLKSTQSEPLQRNSLIEYFSSEELVHLASNVSVHIVGLKNIRNYIAEDSPGTKYLPELDRIWSIKRKSGRIATLPIQTWMQQLRPGKSIKLAARNSYQGGNGQTDRFLLLEGYPENIENGMITVYSRSVFYLDIDSNSNTFLKISLVEDNVNIKKLSEQNYFVSSRYGGTSMSRAPELSNFTHLNLQFYPGVDFLNWLEKVDETDLSKQSKMESNLSVTAIARSTSLSLQDVSLGGPFGIFVFLNYDTNKAHIGRIFQEVQVK